MTYFCSLKQLAGLSRARQRAGGKSGQHRASYFLTESCPGRGKGEKVE